jgi:hypothetical protein
MAGTQITGETKERRKKDHRRNGETEEKRFTGGTEKRRIFFGNEILRFSVPPVIFPPLLRFSCDLFAVTRNIS